MYCVLQMSGLSAAVHSIKFSVVVVIVVGVIVVSVHVPHKT